MSLSVRVEIKRINQTFWWSSDLKACALVVLNWNDVVTRMFQQFFKYKNKLLSFGFATYTHLAPKMYIIAQCSNK